jgi:hypothetical protein
LCVCVCVCVCVCLYVYIYVYIHTYTFIYMYLYSKMLFVCVAHRLELEGASLTYADVCLTYAWRVRKPELEGASL